MFIQFHIKDVKPLHGPPSIRKKKHSLCNIKHTLSGYNFDMFPELDAVLLSSIHPKTPFVRREMNVSRSGGRIGRKERD